MLLDEEDYHLVVTVYSELDDMDKLTELEDKLFNTIIDNKQDSYLNNVVIAQR